MDFPTIIALVGLIGTGGATAVAIVWKLTRVETALREAIVHARLDGDARQDSHAREAGEGLAALRTKINEVELHLRDNYVRRDSFLEVHRQLAGDMRQMREELIGRLDRLDAKLDERTRGAVTN